MLLDHSATDLIPPGMDEIAAAALGEAPAIDAVGKFSTFERPMLTMPFNVTGHPAMSVPTGKGEGGLPLSLQVVGRPFDEATVFRIGRAIERATGWDGPEGVPPGF